MGKRMPETCWAVFTRRAINPKDWCIWLVDLFEYNMYSSGNIDVRNWVHLFESRCITQQYLHVNVKHIGLLRRATISNMRFSTVSTPYIKSYSNKIRCRTFATNPVAKFLLTVTLTYYSLSLTLCSNIFNPLNAELNPICHLLALLGVHHFLHVSKIRVKSPLGY